MGFLESFFGYAAANMCTEKEREDKKNKEWNDLFHQIQEQETKFSNYLASIGCNALYIADINGVDTGNISQELKKIDDFMEKIKEFISYGGLASNIQELDKLDDYISIMKYLKKMNYINRQDDFLELNLELIKEILEEEKAEQVKLLLNDTDNEFDMQLQNNQNNSVITTESLDFSALGEGYIINNVLMWNPYENKFDDILFKLSFNYDRIELYLNSDKVAEVEVPRDTYTNISLTDIEDENKIIVNILGSIFIMDILDANNLKEYYDSYDNEIDVIMSRKQREIIEISKKINGLDNMALNMLNMIDEKLMLNHDTVIMMQAIWSYYRFRSIKLLDEESTSDENQLMAVALVEQYIDNMIEIIEEKNDFSKKQIKFACWEAIRRVSIQFYSELWEQRYGKYLDKPLKQNESEEPDETLDRYIQSIIICNEIDDTDALVECIFTYYMMGKGYVTGELYYPPFCEMVVNVFSTFRENMKKNMIKEKLRGIVIKEEVHYNIDDIDMMNGNEFEHFICELYKKMGYSAEVTKQSGDQGLDVIAERNGKKIGIQAKCYSSTVGNSAVQEAVAGKSHYNCDKVVVITNNYFTSAALELAQSNDVILWNRDILKDKIKELM